MVVTCDIEFENNPEGAYYAGQVITGKVTLTADKVKQVKAVNLRIKGSAKTAWKESNTGTHKGKWYRDEVDYINTVTCLLAPKATDQAVVIEPGIHTFNFACHIPSNCPSSLEACHGSIRYIAKVSLERPWKFDQNFMKGFTVLAIVNLNLDRCMLKLPVKTDIIKNFCCGPCKSPPLEINAQLPQSGYVPGQLIPISIMVTNNTMTNISEISARLVMVITCFSRSMNKTKIQTKVVSKLTGDPVLRYCKKNFNYLLPVPATPPTCMTLCSIIQINYRVEVEAKMKHIFYRNQCICIPVTIGNVPLQMEGMVVQEQPQLRQLNLDNIQKSDNKIENSYDSSTSNENKDPWADIGNIPAPVYMEAIHMSIPTLAKDTADENGEKQFTPKYPVFNVPSPTSQLPTIVGDEIDGHGVTYNATDPNKTTWL